VSDDIGYYCDGVDFQILWAVRERLYHHKPLTGDERRDLANTMDAVLHRIRAFPVEGT